VFGAGVADGRTWSLHFRCWD